MLHAVVNTQGGVAKTTTAIHLAPMLARSDRTLLIDGDPQANSASRDAWWGEADRNPSPTTRGLTGKAILAEGKDPAANDEIEALLAAVTP
jgi:chromosome partitioning protein